MTATESTHEGLLIEPGDPRWDEARAAWNLALDQQPAAVVLAVDVDDVVAAVTVARDRGWRIAAQSTGHNATPLGHLGDTLLVKTAAMDSVTVDAEQRRARVGGGAIWGDVCVAAAEHGLAPLAGSSADVGVVGYTLGGGLSWLGRRHGLACTNVHGIQIVTPDGAVRWADPDNEPDLFWALRGGGGNFGVVTALEISVHPLETVYSGQFFWPLERAADVLPAWRDWAARLSTDTSTCIRLLRFPPMDEIPEPLRGGSFFAVEVAHLGTEADGAPLVEPMRALEPAMDLLAEGPSTQLMGLHMDPPHPVPYGGGGGLLTDLPDAAITALLGVVGAGQQSSLLSVEIRGLGGAIAEPCQPPAALAAITAPYAVFCVGMAPPPMVPAVIADVDQAMAALSPWLARPSYGNFVEQSCEPEALWSDEALTRLRELAERYDPDGMMRANHPLR